MKKKKDSWPGHLYHEATSKHLKSFFLSDIFIENEWSIEFFITNRIVSENKLSNCLLYPEYTDNIEKFSHNMFGKLSYIFVLPCSWGRTFLSISSFPDINSSTLEIFSFLSIMRLEFFFFLKRMIFF